jgi:hypothetical protein
MGPRERDRVSKYKVRVSGTVIGAEVPALAVGSPPIKSLGVAEVACEASIHWQHIYRVGYKSSLYRVQIATLMLG